MMTKSYLFAAVTSTLILLLVVPILNDLSFVPTEFASIAALSVISVAFGGLAAETYVIVKRRTLSAMPGSNAKKYFMSLSCSLFFLAIVAPSIRSAAVSAGVVDAATVVVLLVLSLALGGLTAEGFFAYFSLKTTTRQNVVRDNGPDLVVARRESNQEEQNGSGALSQTSQNTLDSPSDGKEKFDVARHIDSRFKALDVTLETRMQELKLLLGAIPEGERERSPNGGAKSKVETPSTSASTKAVQVKPHQTQQAAPEKDQVVDVLLGKAKTGGK